jgi:prevent-host-death family protein
MNVSVREPKAKVSRYLEDAQAGKDMVVTSRGRPVARLSAVEGNGVGKPSGEELL